MAETRNFVFWSSKFRHM